jgi:hypothetical protein
MNVRISVAAAFVLFLALPLRAQDAEPPVDPNLPPPVSLTYVDGEVQYLNAGAAERADAPSMLVDGDGLRTSRGRAELVFGDGSVLHVDEQTAVDLLGERRLRLLAGRIVFRASAAAPDGYLIDTPAGSIRLDSRGEYNVAVDDRERGLTVAVARGVAEIDQSPERVVVRSGEEARLDGPGARPQIRTFNSARLDAFERWSLTRYEGEALSDSSRRLPSELRAYGQTFDRYGRWDYIEPYGQVWYPSVAAAWRPYYNGGWRRTRYGMTWYGNDPWAWPTHHYGRWQYGSGLWFWVPARVWGPAWVTWAYAPGYVSWAPLGWDARPVVPFYASVGRFHPDRWRAWTVMPRGYLGRRGPIRPWVVDGHRLPTNVSAGFVQRPIPSSYAIRRGDAVGPTGGFDRAVPRGSFTDRKGVTQPGPATPANEATGAQRRDPYAASPPRSGPSRTFEQEWGGAARPGAVARPRRDPDQAPAAATTPTPTPAPTPQERPGAIRRGDSPAYTPRYTPRERAVPDSRPTPEPRDEASSGTRTGSARGDGRSPRSARPESSPRYERPAPSAPAPAPRADGARPRGESGRPAPAARPRGGDGGGGAKGSEGSSGTRSGSARRPPGH